MSPQIYDASDGDKRKRVPWIAVMVDIGGKQYPAIPVKLIGGGGSLSWPLLADDGAVGAPSYSFTSDPDSGLYRAGANDLGIAAGGADALRISAAAVTAFQNLIAPSADFGGGYGSTGVTIDSSGNVNINGNLVVDGTYPGGVSYPLLAPDGSEAAPSYSFAGDTDSGMYWVDTNFLRFSVNGDYKLSLTNSGMFVTDKIQTGDTGSEAAPSISFSGGGGRTNSGMFSPALNELGLTAGASEAIRLTATAVKPLNQVLAPTGSLGAPAYSFDSDPNTGIYRPGNDVLGLATGAGSVLLDGHQLKTLDGSVGAPSYSFASSANKGIYSTGANNIGIATAGAARVDIGASGLTMKSQGQVILDPGGVGTPGLTFATDLDSGMYRAGADDIGLAVGGADALRLSTTALTAFKQILAQDGTTGAPGYSFASDPDTGMFSSIANVLFLATAGNVKVQISSADVRHTVTTVVPSGAVGTPSLKSSGDADTGLFWPTPGEMAVAANGSEVARFTDTDQILGAFLFTSVGGIAKKMINKTGVVTVKGTVVQMDTVVDEAFILAVADSKEPVGIVYEAGVADASSAWVVFSGKAEVLLEDGSASTRAYWARTSITQAGRADMTNAAAPGPVATHFAEIGHCARSDGSGTDVMSLAEVHFN